MPNTFATLMGQALGLYEQGPAPTKACPLNQGSAVGTNNEAGRKWARPFSFQQAPELWLNNEPLESTRADLTQTRTDSIQQSNDFCRAALPAQRQ